MLKFIAKRFSLFVFIMFCVSVGCFYLIHLLPGNPITAILGATSNSPAVEAARKKLTDQLGLNKPLYEQYFVWIGNILRGNFGVSPVTDVPVLTTISSAVPLDVELTALSQAMALLMAVPLAMRAARKPSGWFDRIATTTSFVFLSIPTFVIIVFLQNLMAVQWNVPYTSPYLYTPGGDWVSNILIMLLPAFCIALSTFVIYYRVLRAELIQTYYEDFITLARSKGLNRRRIMWRHAFRPSAIPLLTTLGLVVGGSAAGLFVVEFLTGIPGLGWQLITAVQQVDYLTVQGIVLVITAFFVALLFLVDILLALVDPRISLD